MTGTKERRVTAEYEGRLNYIVDACANAESGRSGHFEGFQPGPGKKLFDYLDYEAMAKYSGAVKGPALTIGEISEAIINAINEKAADRKKPGIHPGKKLVTTNHILFQFYLIKRALSATTK